MLGRERRVLELRPIHEIVDRHHAVQVHRPRDLVQIVAGERELLEQVAQDLIRAVVRRLQAHRIPVAARGELALDGPQQVVHFLLFDEQVAVARDPKLIAAAHAHAGEQPGYECLDDRAEKHEMPAAQLIGQPNEPRQRARRLDHRKSAVAPEAILAFDDDGEIQALVQHLGERARGIQRQGAQHRLHFAAEILGQPLRLRVGPRVRREENHAVPRELRHQHVVEQLVLLIDQARGARADRLQLLGDRQSVRAALHRAGLQQLLEARDPDLEEFVEIGAGDAQESHPLEQRNGGVLGLLEHALIEFEERQFAIDVELGGVQVAIVHAM